MGGNVSHDIDVHITIHSLYGFISYYFYWYMFEFYSKLSGFCLFTGGYTEDNRDKLRKLVESADVGLSLSI